MLAGPSLIIMQQTTVAAPTTKLSTWPCHFNFSHIFFAFPHACVAYHTKISSFSSLLPRATEIQLTLRNVKQDENSNTHRGEAWVGHPLLRETLSLALCFALCYSPGQQCLSLPYLRDPKRIIDPYKGSEHDRHKCTTIKKIYFFLTWKPTAIHRFIFLKSPNLHFLFLVPNLFPLSENTKASEISHLLIFTMTAKLIEAGTDI